MESIAPIGVRTVNQLIDHAATRLDDASKLLAKPKAAGGRREAGVAIIGALHEARLSMERVGASGVAVEGALSKLTIADELILDRLPSWLEDQSAMLYTLSSVHTRTPANAAISAARQAVGELGASRKLDAAIAAVPDSRPRSYAETLEDLELLAASFKADSGGHVKPMTLAQRVRLETTMRSDVLLTDRARAALRTAHGAVAGLTPDGAGKLPINKATLATLNGLGAAVRTERAAQTAIRDALESIDELIVEHVRIMRDGIDLAAPPTTSEFVEMVSAHTAATADSTSQLVDAGRYRLLSRRLQRWEDSGDAIRHAYDAAVSATRAEVVATRIPSSADDYVGQLLTDVRALATHSQENMLRVKDAAARGAIRRTIFATSIRPETLERTDLHETIANRAAQIQARHGEPLRRLESYREVFEDLDRINAEVAT